MFSVGLRTVLEYNKKGFVKIQMPECTSYVPFSLRDLKHEIDFPPFYTGDNHHENTPI